MLILKHITKDYTAGDTTVHALKGIDLQFRESEFVSILGHSGCGKTTLLNLIGGLDHYTSGDLVINGRSTKDFSDGDWDTYRNHSVGFVFQTYNLIPHQSVLANVELALTLSGVGKAERRRRAEAALEQVGLGDQKRKKPNQLSGGQMQRVAIARALVNDPDILLADEPTGALDSETSVQIMEILREISKDKLIIMVTHNPDLAEAYSTRIIRLSDGLVTGDTRPPVPEEEPAEAGKDVKKQKKPSMGFFTALSLSLNNLMTKKGRTILTAFAGSIGIVGIALILALSNGIQAYIDRVQADTLSSYPITIEHESVDLSAMVSGLMGRNRSAGESAHPDDAVYSSTVLYDLVNSVNAAGTTVNDLKEFRAFLESGESGLDDYVTSIRYSYDADMSIYTEDADGAIVKSDVTELFQSAMSAMYGGDYSSYFSTYGAAFERFQVWEEMLAGDDGEIVSDLLKEQYDVLYGRWPEAYDEVVLIVDENNEVSDLVLYALGLKTNGELTANMAQAMEQEQVQGVTESWSYEEVCQKTFKAVPAFELWQPNGQGGYSDVTASEAGLRFLYDSEDVGITLHVVGVLRQSGDRVSGMLSGAIGYPSALTREILDRTVDAEIIAQQLSDPGTDVFSGLPFADGDYDPTPAEKTEAVLAYIAGLTPAEKAALYTAAMSVPEQSWLDETVDGLMAQMDRETIETTMLERYSAETGMDLATLSDYIARMDDETLFETVRTMAAAQAAEQYARQVQEQLGAMTTDQLAALLDLGDLREDQYVYLFDTAVPSPFAEGSCDENLETLGYVDLEAPDTIEIFAATFADKDRIAEAIARYNETVDEAQQITYTDYVALLMSSITTIINAISYVLIAFVAISLVVSSIMIGIITYISVLERTKEIGILRAIGASKRDISRVFNAETLTVGFFAGVIGIGLTLLLTVPVNLIVRSLTGIPSLGAVLPAGGAVILVVISMLLTFIAGLIPSGIASRKDPVEALRTE